MAKRIKNPIEVRAVIHFEETGSHIDSALIRYTLSCEHDIEERKELYLLQNQEIQNCVKDFGEEGLEQVDIHESIAEEESLIDYPRPV